MACPRDAYKKEQNSVCEKIMSGDWDDSLSEDAHDRRLIRVWIVKIAMQNGGRQHVKTLSFNTAQNL